VLMLLWCVHQGPGATAELAALVHGVAGLAGLLLTPDLPPAAPAQHSIDRSAAALPVLTHLTAMFHEMLCFEQTDSMLSACYLQRVCALSSMPLPGDLIMLLRSWHGFAAGVQKLPQSAFPRELLRAVAAVSKALQGAFGKSGGGGTVAAGLLEARAAADAVAAELLQVCVLADHAAYRASVQTFHIQVIGHTNRWPESLLLS
jgi:hypothetical protein